MSNDSASHRMKRRSPVGVWLLALITLGIYFYVWYYKIHRELLSRFPDQQINPTGSLLTMLFGWLIIVPPLVSIYNTGGRVARAEQAVGIQVPTSGVIGLLLYWLFGLNMVYYQSKLNAVIEADLQPDRNEAAHA